MAVVEKERERIELRESSSVSVWRSLEIIINDIDIESIGNYKDLKRFLALARAALAELIADFELVPVAKDTAIILTSTRPVGEVSYDGINKKLIIKFREIDIFYVECGGCQT